MEHELLPLINELSHLAVTRNAINTRRHRARFRKNYYAHALRVVEAHNNSNYELRRLRGKLDNLKIGTTDSVLEAARLNEQIARIEIGMKWLIAKYPKPKKWQAMGLHKLRSLILQGEGEYAMAKHETMEFSIKHRSRVKYLVTMLNCSLSYDNGALNAIHFKKDGNRTFFDLEEIHHHAEQYELDKAIEKIVEE